MIGRNTIVKNAENFSVHNAKFFPENSLPFMRERKKKNKKRIDHAYLVHSVMIQ